MTADIQISTYLSRTDGFTKLAGDTALLSGWITTKSMLSSKQHFNTIRRFAMKFSNPLRRFRLKNSISTAIGYFMSPVMATSGTFWSLTYEISKQR